MALRWDHWRKLFHYRRQQGLPELTWQDPALESVPASVARSLAVFQLGESGGGRVIGQASNSSIAGIDGDYVAALRDFVEEEHRHAELLALCIRALGGELIRDNWTAKLFVFSRRLIGLRLKILVLLVAEIVGCCFYELIARNLPVSSARSILETIIDDEKLHLEFHCAFLRSQVSGAGRRLIFVPVWRCVSFLAAITVIVDHRQTLKDLGISKRQALRTWMGLSRVAEHRITGSSPLQVLPPRLITD